MADVNRCRECGTELPPDSPAGHCPACLFKLGVEGDPSQPEVAATLDSPVPGSPPGGFAPPSIVELAERFPQIEIIELLGQGGMGAVYKARQPKLDRYVALKILPPHLGNDPAFAERFAREAQALARLNHPNIVTVYDFGDVDGLYFFVMEFVDGVNLRQSILAKKLSADEALAIVPQICDALQFAHEEGVVHRDIKPENVLLDTRGRVKITDFGLAKLLGRSTSDRQLTIGHQVMGTMHYMAPEQMEKPLEVDHRADIYSLGVVFYELLTGELPIGRFDPPSRKAAVGAELDKVVLRALEKELHRRYQQASDVKADVDRISRLGNPDLRSVTEPSPAAKLVSSPAALTLAGKVMGSGTVRFDGSHVTLDFELSEDDAAWFEGSTPHYPRPCKPGRHEVVIPVSDIAAAEFKTGWFGGQMRITTHTPRPVADVPGSDQATVILAVTKDNARLARQLVAAIERSLGREATRQVDGTNLEDARRQVQGPAIGMIATGAFCVLPLVIAPLLVVFDDKLDYVNFLLLSPILLIAIFVSIPIAGIIALAAFKMRRLELYGLAVTASILAMLPCHPGFIIGLPIGLWSLFMLSKPEVKAAFRENIPIPARHERNERRESQMTKNQRILFFVAFVLSGVAALLFVAGTPQFDLMPRTYANFGGIAVGVVSAAFWALFGLSCSGQERQ